VIPDGEFRLGRPTLPTFCRVGTAQGRVGNAAICVLAGDDAQIQRLKLGAVVEKDVANVYVLDACHPFSGYPVNEVVRTVGAPRFDFHGFLLGFAQNGNQPQGMVHPNERWIEHRFNYAEGCLVDSVLVAQHVLDDHVLLSRRPPWAQGFDVASCLVTGDFSEVDVFTPKGHSHHLIDDRHIVHLISDQDQPAMPGMVPGRVEIEMLTPRSTNLARGKKWTNSSIFHTTHTFADATKYARSNFSIDRTIICFALLARLLAEGGHLWRPRRAKP